MIFEQFVYVLGCLVVAGSVPAVLFWLVGCVERKR